MVFNFAIGMRVIVGYNSYLQDDFYTALEGTTFLGYNNLFKRDRYTNYDQAEANWEYRIRMDQKIKSGPNFDFGLKFFLF